MSEIQDMTFNEIVELHKEMDAENTRLRTLLAEAVETIHKYNRDEDIMSLNQTISTYRNQVARWREIAEALHDGLILAQMQLAGENIGVRPLARDAIQAYRDATNQ
jgi:hypothetical protein